MSARILQRTMLSRRETLVALGGAFLPRPTTARNRDGGMCTRFEDMSDEQPGFAHATVRISHSVGETADFQIWHTNLGVGPQGQVTGYLLRRDTNGTTTYTPVLGSAEVVCGDRDGDGRVGISAITFLAQDRATEAPFPVAITTWPGEEVDSSGFGFVTFQTGEDPPFEAEARVTLARRPRRRRRRRR